MGAMNGRPQDTSYHRDVFHGGEGHCLRSVCWALSDRPVAVPLFIWPVRSLRAFPWIGFRPFGPGVFRFGATSMSTASIPELWVVLEGCSAGYHAYACVSMSFVPEIRHVHASAGLAPITVVAVRPPN